jgi:hypothetical protein
MPHGPHPVTAMILIYQQVCLYEKNTNPELAALSGRLVRLAQKPALFSRN